MAVYRSKKILDNLDNLDVPEDPEAENFAPLYVRGDTKIDEVSEDTYSKDTSPIEPGNRFEWILADKVNKNISFRPADVSHEVADFYRVVKFGENYSLIQSINLSKPGKPDISDSFNKEDGVTVLHYLTTDNENFIFEDGKYGARPNYNARNIHQKTKRILEEDQLSETMLEPSD